MCIQFLLKIWINNNSLWKGSLVGQRAKRNLKATWAKIVLQTALLTCFIIKFFSTLFPSVSQFPGKADNDNLNWLNYATSEQFSGLQESQILCQLKIFGRSFEFLSTYLISVSCLVDECLILPLCQKQDNVYIQDRQTCREEKKEHLVITEHCRNELLLVLLEATWLNIVRCCKCCVGFPQSCAGIPFH